MSPPAGTSRKPSVARAEIVDKATRARFESELDAALKRKPTNEVKLAGALRAVAVLSPALRGALVEATQMMVRRGSYAREIYGACLRTLAECDDRNVPALLKTALAADDAGGNGQARPSTSDNSTGSSSTGALHLSAGYPRAHSRLRGHVSRKPLAAGTQHQVRAGSRARGFHNHDYASGTRLAVAVGRCQTPPSCHDQRRCRGC